MELSNSKRKQLGLGSTDKEILSIRQAWEQIANAHLERAGIAERIDHRSYKEQGNGKIAQIHETPQITAMRRKGKETEISQTNDERKAYNTQISQEPQQEEKEQRQSKLLTSAQDRL
ncbi:MobA/MobL family protein, partial [Kingella kingae]|uniref:MobA/MobL family protein n=1 Tax=Kingella kingae TaxID=504 RepID=UPI00254ADA27